MGLAISYLELLVPQLVSGVHGVNGQFAMPIVKAIKFERAHALVLHAKAQPQKAVSAMVHVLQLPSLHGGNGHLAAPHAVPEHKPKRAPVSAMDVLVRPDKHEIAI